MFHSFNQQDYYLDRIDALLNHIEKLETFIEKETDFKIKDKYGKKYI
tara:strand:+ start:311 stop:451 length:141 start_codon:yes stop_codon:yes gene_type:complete